jgi:hypothetical protein
LSAVGLIGTLLMATAAPAIAAPPPVDPAAGTEVSAAAKVLPAAGSTAGSAQAAAPAPVAAALTGSAEPASPAGPPAASNVPSLSGTPAPPANEATATNEAGPTGAGDAAQPPISDSAVPQLPPPPSAETPSSTEIQPQEVEAATPPVARILVAPTMALVATPAATASLGTSVTFTATVTGTGPIPEGAVSFTAGGTAIAGCGSQTLVPTVGLDAEAICTTSSLTAGTFDVVAGYTPSGTSVGVYDPTNATVTGYIVTQVAPTMAVTSANPATSAELGVSVAFTATVTGPAGAPTPSAGTVSFTANGAAIAGCTAVALPTGLMCTTSALSLGAQSITASYNGTADPNYTDAPASAALGYTITEATPTVTVASANPPTPGTLGAPVTFTATVTGAAGAPSGGTVSFTSDAAAISGCTAAALPAGLVCTTSGLTGGSHAIVASYDGTADPNYLGAASGSFSYAITEAAPTVTLVASPATSAALGASVTLTATVSGGAGPAPSLGTVTFTDGGSAVAGCAPVTLPATPLQCVTTGLTGGTHSIVASYDGTLDPNYTDGASAALSYSIAEGTPTVSVSALPASPVAVGTSVTITATVTGVAGAPAPAGGTAIFTEGVAGPAVPGCTPVTLPATPVECVTTGLTGGTHNIVVSYNGTSDPSYTNGDSSALSYTVTEVAPTVTLVANPSGSVALGTPVTFTATVTGAGGGPAPVGGTVSFTQGVGGPAVPGCSAVTLPAPAQCVTSGLTVGAHANIVATYNGGGDVSYTNDDSPLLSLAITPAAPTVTLAAVPAASAQLGGSAVFTASVTGVAGTPPSGTVNFTDGAAGPTIVGCTAQPVASGSAQCTTTGLGLGSHTIVANYSGDTNYLAGSATLAGYQITRATPVVTLTAAPAGSVVVGSSASFTASVAGVSGVPAPIGTVSFTVDGVAIAACPAVTLPTSPVCTPPPFVAVGPHTVVATYSGDTNYLAGSATIAGYPVTARTSAVTLLVSPAGPVDVGASVTLTAVVTGDGSGILPTGTVAFAASAGSLATLAGCEAVPVSGSGLATCTTTALPAGSVRIVASYSGGPVYAPSSGEVSGYVVNASLALTGTGEEAGTGTETETGTELANTGAGVDRMLLGALLLLGAGAGFLAFGSALSGRRRATRLSGADLTRHNRRF